MPHGLSAPGCLGVFSRLNGPLAAATKCPRRQFSSSAMRCARATFTETDNSELNTLLDEIQAKIILPGYLPEAQRKIVFDPKMKQRLQRNPIIIEVDGIEHRFPHIDPAHDIERPKNIMFKALRQMKSAREWENLDVLLRGYRKAGVVLKYRQLNKIARLAGASGNIQAVIECAKKADKTGMRLWDEELVVHTMTELNGLIVANKGDALKAIHVGKQTQVILDLVEREREDQQRPGPGNAKGPQVSVLVRSLSLFAEISSLQAKKQLAAAATATASEGGEGSAIEDYERDETLVLDDIRFLRSQWGISADNDAGIDALDIPAIRSLSPVYPALRARCKGRRFSSGLGVQSYVKAIAQSIRAMEMAADYGNGNDLAPCIATLENQLGEMVRTRKEIRPVWAAEYEQILGRQPAWAS